MKKLNISDVEDYKLSRKHSLQDVIDYNSRKFIRQHLAHKKKQELSDKSSQEYVFHSVTRSMTLKFARILKHISIRMKEEKQMNEGKL